MTFVLELAELVLVVGADRIAMGKLMPTATAPREGLSTALVDGLVF